MFASSVALRPQGRCDVVGGEGGSWVGLEGRGTPLLSQLPYYTRF
jgi:hypothetical protein